jgi:hypothetical protein
MTPTPLKRSLSLAAIAALCLTGAAGAQSRSSFLDGGTFSGIDIVPSNGGLTYDVTFNPGAQFHFGGNDYDITDIFGFWNLSDDDDLTVTNANFLDGDGATWSINNKNAGTGGIAGWDTNPNTGITSGQTVQFSYSALSVASVEHPGFHIRIDGQWPGGGGNTGFATFNDVPTPGAAALLGVAGLVGGLGKRRR